MCSAWCGNADVRHESKETSCQMTFLPPPLTAGMEEEDETENVVRQVLEGILQEGLRRANAANMKAAQCLRSLNSDQRAKDQLLAPLTATLCDVRTKDDLEDNRKCIKDLMEQYVDRSFPSISGMLGENDQVVEMVEEAEEEQDKWGDEVGATENPYSIFTGKDENRNQGSFSLLSMLDLPEVRMIDLGAVAAQLQGSMKEKQIAGLKALETSMWSELTYSEHWSGVCEGLARLVAASTEAVLESIGDKASEGRVPRRGVRASEQEQEGQGKDDSDVCMRVIKMYWELFTCLSPGQRADIYLAVAADLVNTFRSRLWVLPNAGSPSLPAEEDVSSPPGPSPPCAAALSIEGTPHGRLLCAKVGLLHRMQQDLPSLFPHLPDLALHQVLAWTCLLLRTLHSPSSPSQHPHLLLSPIHLFAALDASAHWFKSWCLRLPPPKLSYFLQRTGLLGDILHVCRPLKEQPGHGIGLDDSSRWEDKGDDAVAASPALASREEEATVVRLHPLPRVPDEPDISSLPPFLCSFPPLDPRGLTALKQSFSLGLLSHLGATASLTFHAGSESGKAREGCVGAVSALWGGAVALRAHDLPSRLSDVCLAPPPAAPACSPHLRIATSTASAPPSSPSSGSYLISCAELFLHTLLVEDTPGEHPPMQVSLPRIPCIAATTHPSAAADCPEPRLSTSHPDKTKDIAFAHFSTPAHINVTSGPFYLCQSAAAALLELPLPASYRMHALGRLIARLRGPCPPEAQARRLVLTVLALRLSTRCGARAGPGGGDADGVGTGLEDLRFLHRHAVRLCCTRSLATSPPLSPASINLLQRVYCESLFSVYRTQPCLFDDLPRWPLHVFLPLLVTPPTAATEIMREDDAGGHTGGAGLPNTTKDGKRSQEFAYACLGLLCWDYRGMRYLSRLGGSLFYGLTGALCTRVLDVLEREEDGGEDDGDERRGDEQSVCPFLTPSLPFLPILLQNIASVGPQAPLAGLLSTLLACLFQDFPRRHGLRYAEDLSSPLPLLQPPRLRHTLCLALVLARELASRPFEGLEDIAAPHVAVLLEWEKPPLMPELGGDKAKRALPREPRGRREGVRPAVWKDSEAGQLLSLRLLISMASTLNGAAWLVATFPALNAALCRASALWPSSHTSSPSPGRPGPPGSRMHSTFVSIGKNAGDEKEERAADDNLLGALYLRALLHQEKASSALPPPPPLRDEEEIDAALAVLSVQRAMDSGGLRYGWGAMPVHFFQEHAVRKLERAGSPLSLTRLLEEGYGMGGEKNHLLPVCWEHVRRHVHGGPERESAGGGASKGSTDTCQPGWGPEARQVAPGEPSTCITRACHIQIDMVIVHAARWGLLPDEEAEKTNFRRSLLSLVQGSSSVMTVWELSIWLIMACGKGEEEVLPLLLWGRLPPKRSQERGLRDGRVGQDDGALADETVTALDSQMPEINGALTQCGLSTRAVVLSWFTHSFWGALSVTELAISETLYILHGPAMRVGVALSLFKFMREDLLVAAARQYDVIRVSHIVEASLKRFEFTPQVMEGLREAHARLDQKVQKRM